LYSILTEDYKKRKSIFDTKSNIEFTKQTYLLQYYLLPWTPEVRSPSDHVQVWSWLGGGSCADQWRLRSSGHQSVEPPYWTQTS